MSGTGTQRSRGWILAPGHVRLRALRSLHPRRTGSGRPGLRDRLPPSLLAATLLLASCAGGNGAAASQVPAGAVVLGRGTYINGAESFPYELLRLPSAGGGHSYAQWFPPRRAAPTPVIVSTVPYGGIDWTGEAVDQRWAAQGNGCFPDADGPGYQAGVSSPVCYEKFTPDRVGGDNQIDLLNGFGVLATFGRFYAGGSVWNDVEDTLAGLAFLGTQASVDAGRIGVIGGSWGGFEAVYGSAYADVGVPPKVAVAISPVIDFQDLVNHIDFTIPLVTDAVTRPRYTSFFDPYLRRLFATTGGRPAAPGADYSKVTADALGPRLQTRLLVIHDSGDTILPVAASTSFVAANPAHAQGFWYEQSSTIDYNANVLTHGPFGSPTVYASIYTFSVSYLLTALGDGGQALFVPYGDADLDRFFQDLRAYQAGGRDVAWVVPRLQEWCDARVHLFDLTPGRGAPVVSGAHLLATKLNARWGTAFDDATVCDQLAVRGLP